MHELQLISPADYDGIGEVGPFPMERYALHFLAQGDSWFSIGAFPPWKTSNLFDKLSLSRAAVAVNCARPGAELVHMIDSTRNRGFLQLLNGKKAMRWTALLLSGLGNDVISASQSPATALPHQRLLARADEWGPPGSAARYISQPGWAAFDAHAREVFRLLLLARDKTAVNRGIPVVLHTYDIMTPRGAPAGPGFGPWLYKAVKAYGIDEADWLPLSTELVQRVGTLIHSIAAGEPTVHVVDTLGTLNPAGTQQREPSEHWHNEIHPTKAGYRRLGDVWEERLEAWFCGA